LPIMKPLKTAIGLMSGTSMDGIDVALLRSDGEGRVERGPSLGIAYDPAFRKVLSQALEIAKRIEKREERPENLGEIERDLTLRHAMAVDRFLDRFNFRRQDVDLIGFHGQTVLHRPLLGLTVQIGDGALLARETGIDVVHDMRANDMRFGGQGAPLVPVYHAALAAGLADYTGRAVMFVNIGGISNLTYIGGDGEIIAFDSGPGNTLIDQWVEAEAGVPFDQGGAIASEGFVLESLKARYLDHPFFTSEKRMSLDRNDFLPPSRGEAGLHDGARTLAQVTAAGILISARHLPAPPALIIVSGGGRLNRVIMTDLAALAPMAKVAAAEEFGFNGDSMEAEAWAYLAIRSAQGLPLTFPSTTGVRAPVSGGLLARARASLG
jgi:anhydro-N-acetylmuramic acid kinase